ncbi:MAG: transporter [Oxalobacter sp.]|nr:transporter [Oxalobacter sp.]
MLSSVIRTFRNWTLPIAMVAGGIGYPFFQHLSPLLPYLIFVMLTVTFCKVALTDIRITFLHIILLSIQIAGAIGIYYALHDINVWVAEGMMICIIAPTATAAAVITDKLGGSAASITSFTLLSNIGCALTAPALFPIIHPLGVETDYWHSVLLIMQQVFPLLICPFLAAMCLRRFFPKLNSRILDFPDTAFYLWAVTITILMGKTIAAAIEEQENLILQLWIAIASLAVCCLQFGIGKLIGTHWNMRITSGQALGQKNTVFAIWLAHTYMTPVSAIGAGAYVVWQNIINSWQLWHQRKQMENGKAAPTQKEGQQKPQA